MKTPTAGDLFRKWRKKTGLTLNEIALKLTDVNCYTDEKLIGNWFRNPQGQRKPSPIPPECQLALLQLFRPVCTAEEALEWVVLTKLPIDDWPKIKALFPEAEFEQALLKVMEQRLALKLQLHPMAQIMGYKPQVEFNPRGQGRLLPVEAGMFLHAEDILYTYQEAEATLLCLQGEPKLLKIQANRTWKVNCSQCRSEWILTYLNQDFVERVIGENTAPLIAHYFAQRYPDEALLLLAIQLHYQNYREAAAKIYQLLRREYPQSPHHKAIETVLGYEAIPLKDYVSRLSRQLIAQIAPHLSPHVPSLEAMFWARLTPQLAISETPATFLTSPPPLHQETLTLMLATYLTTQHLITTNIPLQSSPLLPAIQQQAQQIVTSLELTEPQMSRFIHHYVELVRHDLTALFLIKR